MYHEKQLKSLGLQSLQAASAQTFDLNTQKVSKVKEIQFKKQVCGLGSVTGLCWNLCSKSFSFPANTGS